MKRYPKLIQKKGKKRLVTPFSHKIPNKAEFLLLGILAFYELPFKYTGNGTYTIGEKIPDYVSTKEMKVIELFGRYWHKDPDEPRRRTEFFKSAGFDSLIIYDDELKNKKNMDKLIKKILSFNRQKVDVKNDISPPLKEPI